MRIISEVTYILPKINVQFMEQSTLGCEIKLEEFGLLHVH